MKNGMPKWLVGLLSVSGAVLVGYLDWVTGYELDFFVFYFLPVAIGAWLMGMRASVLLAAFTTIVWFEVDSLLENVHSSQFYAVWEAMIHLVSFLVIGCSVSKIRQLLERERKLTEDLTRSLSEVKVLESFLPICCQCKKIRDNEGHWKQLELYIGERTNSRFSHGYCPDCAKKCMEDAGLSEEWNRLHN